MTRIEIVSHCWNYRALWTYQMSSLLLHPPKDCEVLMTVCVCKEEDPETWQRVEDFCRMGGFNGEVCFNNQQKAGRTAGPVSYNGWPNNISIMPWNVEKPRLMRRAIARNWAAKSTAADLVWFADCDYIPGEGSLDALAAYWLENKEEPATALMVPREVKWSTQPRGDTIIAAAKDWTGGPIELDREGFFRRRYHRAIGGVQIAWGSACREHGYIPKSRRYQRTADRWMRTREDPHFRRQLDKIYHTGKGRKVKMPNVSRIRHSERGREKEGLQL